MTTRIDALDAAYRLLAEAGSVSLDSVAKAAGLSKPGLMYHFPTKEALMLALVDHTVDICQQELEALLPNDDPSPRERMAAYLRWNIGHRHDRAEAVLLGDPKLADRLSARWLEHFHDWIEPPRSLPAEERTRLHAARLMADGAWFADVTNYRPLTAAERKAVLKLALSQLEA